jgi:two-component system NtrC family sensor kinase
MGRAMLATVGLALILVVLAGVCTWAARNASSTSADAGRRLQVASAHEAVLTAVLAEQTAQLHYLDDRGTTVHSAAFAADRRRAYAAARGQLDQAIARLRATGDPSDLSLASYVVLVENRYDVTSQRLFAAVDAGDDQEAQRLEHEVAVPAVESLVDLVLAAAERHRSAAAASLSRLEERSRGSARLIPAVFGLAFIFLGGCWALMLNLQRHLRRQTGALTREKALVEGVIAASPALVYWKDAERRYQGGNQAFRQLRAVGPDGELLGGSDADLPADSLSRALTEIEDEVLASQAAVMGRQVTVEGPDGQFRQLLLSVVPRLGQAGNLDGVIGAGADVTHMAELERQLAQASRLESLGQLAAGMAHEINTPIQFVSANTRFLKDSFDGVLSGIHLIAELAQGDGPAMPAMQAALDDMDLAFLSEEVPAAFAESDEGLQRVAQIVRAMKEFSHPGEGRAETDLNRAIESAVQVSRGEWKNVAEMDLDLGDDVGFVPCYVGELRQALLNIVVNAAQAITEDRRRRNVADLGHITIASSRHDGAVRIVVRDDGPGMPEEVQRRVFEPFFTTKTVGQGTGQGLTLAHATVVKKHGGTITVESVAGTGTTFTITLPGQVPCTADDTTSNSAALTVG